MSRYYSPVQRDASSCQIRQVISDNSSGSGEQFCALTPRKEPPNNDSFCEPNSRNKKQVTIAKEEQLSEGERLLDILPSIKNQEYEYPLIDCGCCQLLWTAYFAGMMKKWFGVDLKGKSRKGTPYYGLREPAKPSKLAERATRVTASARRKSQRIKTHLRQELNDWQYKDPVIQEMELELQRLRQQVGAEQNKSRVMKLPENENRQNVW